MEVGGDDQGGHRGQQGDRAAGDVAPEVDGPLGQNDAGQVAVAAEVGVDPGEAEQLDPGVGQQLGHHLGPRGGHEDRRVHRPLPQGLRRPGAAEVGQPRRSPVEAVLAQQGQGQDPGAAALGPDGNSAPRQLRESFQGPGAAVEDPQGLVVEAGQGDQAGLGGGVPHPGLDEAGVDRSFPQQPQILHRPGGRPDLQLHPFPRQQAAVLQGEAVVGSPGHARSQDEALRGSRLDQLEQQEEHQPGEQEGGPVDLQAVAVGAFQQVGNAHRMAGRDSQPGFGAALTPPLPRIRCRAACARAASASRWSLRGAPSPSRSSRGRRGAPATSSRPRPGTPRSVRPGPDPW